MDIKKITDKNFDKEVLQSNKTVLVDFYADWCGPCQMLSPIVEEVASQDDNIKVVKINIDEEQELAVRYEIASIPTLVVIRNGNEIKRSIGVIQKEEIENLVK